MRILFVLIVIAALDVNRICGAEESNGKRFLRYLFGDETVDATEICTQNFDLWMSPGKRDEVAFKSIGAIPERELTNAVAQGIVNGAEQPNLYFFEMVDGKVDARPHLDVIYRLHRELALRFIMGSLSQNQRILERLSTDATKVKVEGPKAAPGDMGVYEDILGRFPVLRSSDPKEDAQSKSVTYRVPLGTNNIVLKLRKAGNTWKVDTTGVVTVPSWSLFR